MANVVLTAVGDDRPGFVEVLAGLISRHGGSWSRSQMARLGGKFAGIVEASLPDDAVEALRAGLVALEAEGLHTTLTVAGTDEPPPGERFRLSLMGTDQPGLVHAVAAALAAAGASIEELATSVSDAPMAGGTVFAAEAVVVLPVGASMHDVRAELEALATHLMVDITVEE
jgi:glycine cleavage system regulatory protein